MALLSTTAAMMASGVGLVILFQRHVELRVDAELDTYIRQIAGNIAFGRDGEITVVRPPADPRFDQPLSGLYWQVGDDQGRSARSRSLWDVGLTLPADRLDDATPHRHLVPGPGHTTLIARERQVTFSTATPPRTLRIVSAIDSNDTRALVRDFAGDLVPSLAMLGLALLAAAWLQVRIGLRPLEAVRRGIGAIRSGTHRRLPLTYPDEVMPLAEEVNTLLDVHDRMIARARAAAADLAHGLKTPLTALGAAARSLRSRGDTALAQDIEDLAETMRRQIERPLARARLQHGHGMATPLAPLVGQLVTTIRKTPTGAARSWSIAIPDALQAAVNRDDLTELLGNLLENAAKWARDQVRVTAEAASAAIAITIDDDGPGIPLVARQTALERGARLDQATAGTGLGLAIVGDIIEVYGGTLRLDDSPLGGLRVTATVPLASAGAVTPPRPALARDR